LKEYNIPSPQPGGRAREGGQRTAKEIPSPL